MDSGSAHTTNEVSKSLIKDIDSLSDDHILVAYDNTTTQFQLVLLVLAVAIPCSPPEAQILASQIHHFGQCEVLQSTYEHCFFVKESLSEINIRAQIFHNKK